MNLVEVWFGIVESQTIRRGVFTFVKDPNAKIRASIDGWHDRAHPFVWTKTRRGDPGEGQPSNYIRSAPLAGGEAASQSASPHCAV